jgi:diguanylate cyclase (GGDEF)-like protein
MIDLILTHYNTQGKSRDQLNFEAKTLINLISPDLVQIGYSNPGRWRHIADTFARFDLVSSDRDLKGFFYQADRKPDITWLYPYLAAALGILGIVSAVSFYICRINFRLRQATRNQAIVESRLREMAFTDALTQLPNRRLLLDRLKQALNSSKRQCSYGAVIFLDLNEFKQLNDTHGHNVGDQLLIEVANRLQLLVRASDTVARLGGDEFVVLLVNLGAELLHATAHANSIAEKIKSALNEEYVLGDIRHHGSASVGIKLFIGDQVDPDQVLHEADEAMYESKKGLVNE